MRFFISILFSLFFTLGCETIDKAEYFYEEDLSQLKRLSLTSDESGIYPSEAVLAEPQNPFLRSPIGDETKWQIVVSAPNPASFYCFATMLAREPTGEHQFYAASFLKLVYENGEALEQHLPIIREMAIAGFQAVLDYFPDSVTYLSDGQTTMRLAPLAYQGIKSLGADPEGDWYEVILSNGDTTVVNGRQENFPDAEDKDEEGNKGKEQ